MFSASAHSACHALRVVALSVAFTACGGDGPAVVETPKETPCNGVATTVLTPAPLEGIVLSGASAACFALAGGDREYLVIPQLTGATLPYGGYGFRLGEPTAVVARAASTDDAPNVQALQTLTVPASEPADAQALLDARLRQRESAWKGGQTVRSDSVLLQSRRTQSAATADSLGVFSVLSTLGEPATYTAVRAQLRYSGTRVLIYVDTLAASSFTDAELTGMGTLYDQRLLPAVTAAFGDGSDIDGNGRVIFVLTPTVNAIVTATQCSATGFVRGFFYNPDLSSTASTSNRGEVFYAYVPDETGRFSCSHTKADVLANLPPTFMHELQHMVSFGEHAIERGGTAEEVWLNEGLSHMAEEIGSLIYEARFPAPTGRTSPTQLFPDSAGAYITPNVLYSYRYLFSSAVYSITSCAPGSFCSQAERGGTWLFLRWLADRESGAPFRRLVETRLTGRANLEAAFGRTTGALLGDFAMAVSADSVLGVARTATPAALRFNSRNLRRLYRSLFENFGIPSGVSRPFPIEPLTLGTGTSVTGTMRPGTFLTYRLRVPAGSPTAVLRLLAADGTPFPLQSGAQVSILRMP